MSVSDKIKALPGLLQAALAGQKDRVVLWLPVLFSFGVGGYFALPFEPSGVLVAALWLVMALLWFLLAPLRFSHAGMTGLWFVLGAFLFVSSGFAAAQLRTERVKAPILEKKLGPVRVEGTIADIDLLTPGAGSRVILDALTIENLPASQTPRRIRIKIHEDRDLKVGARIRVLAGLNPPSAPVAPGAFDFQRYAYFKQIGAFGFAYDKPETISGFRHPSLWGRVDSLRQVIIARIDSRVPQPQAAFAAALMTGERAAITPEDWDAIRAAGLAHMLAISGLHVGIVAGLLFFVARFFMALFPSFALYHPIKKYAAVIAFAGAAGYTILAGAGVPTLRALFMTGIVLLAILLDRQAISMRTVALSALVVLLFSPDALFSASFQMSFAAVTALVFAYDAIRPWWSRLYRGAGRVRRAGMYVAGVVLTTLVAGSAVAPFSLYHFQQYPLYDIPANVLAAPLMTFLIMPGVVLSYFVMPLGLDILAFKPLEWGITGLLLIARNVYELPGATWNPPAWPVAALVCFVLGGLWVVLWQGRLRVMALFLFACGFLIISQYKQPDILVSSSGKLIAVRVDETQMRLSSKVQDRFSGENWARLLGILPEEIRSLQREGAVEGIACGPLGCRTILHGKKIALSFHPAGQKEDCAWADLLIAESSLRVKKCAAPLVRDLYDFYRDGAHSFYLSGSDVREQSVASVRGDRPWTVSNRR